MSTTHTHTHRNIQTQTQLGWKLFQKLVQTKKLPLFILLAFLETGIVFCFVQYCAGEPVEWMKKKFVHLSLINIALYLSLLEEKPTSLRHPVMDREEVSLVVAQRFPISSQSMALLLKMHFQSESLFCRPCGHPILSFLDGRKGKQFLLFPVCWGKAFILLGPFRILHDCLASTTSPREGEIASPKDVTRCWLNMERQRSNLMLPKAHLCLPLPLHTAFRASAECRPSIIVLTKRAKLWSVTHHGLCVAHIARVSICGQFFTHTWYTANTCHDSRKEILVLHVWRRLTE